MAVSLRLDSLILRSLMLKSPAPEPAPQDARVSDKNKTLIVRKVFLIYVSNFKAG